MARSGDESAQKEAAGQERRWVARSQMEEQVTTKQLAVVKEVSREDVEKAQRKIDEIDTPSVLCLSS